MEHIAVSQGVLAQGKLFLTGILGGVLVCFSYDLLRLWRRLIHHGIVWMAVEDVMFFFVWGVAGFLGLYPQSLGQLRVFLILALVIGALIYHFLVSPHLIRGGTWMIVRIRAQGKKLGQKRKKKEPKSP